MPLYNFKTHKYAPRTKDIKNPEEYVPQDPESQKEIQDALKAGLKPLEALIHVLQKFDK